MLRTTCGPDLEVLTCCGSSTWALGGGGSQCLIRALGIETGNPTDKASGETRGRLHATASHKCLFRSFIELFSSSFFRRIQHFRKFSTFLGCLQVSGGPGRLLRASRHDLGSLQVSGGSGRLLRTSRHDLGCLEVSGGPFLVLD